ncbi:FAD-dependent thymidylate synthase [Arcobacter cryaerophilus gv. pseudocryaerophilus]|uniref:FAD-dependent thymidylate synthase n=2 Tax=Arcobacteraceae TaxID=2808963 RepID=A0AAU0P595_9BACT|nr:FAD-dependent thymidylate synthase [Arcobacter sp. AZ-2023]WPD03400.1 FAD-dependent thymidylate synthase [Arcobacter sp. DSM 115972]
MELINKKENIFGDDIAFVEQYNFSTANISEENRIKAITTVASICYQNPKAIGSESLYNRLLAESKGLPSSSFEFVPVILTAKKLRKIGSIINKEIYVKHDFEYNVAKFGEMIEDGKYLLTNLRALIADVGEYAKEFYNTPEECEIIKQHFKVFLYKVDLPTRSQMVRHRVSWQELSRRYVSGSRVPFEFYVSENMKKVNLCDSTKNILIRTSDGDIDDVSFSTSNILNICLDFYEQALKQGVKPQEARSIIPQAAYTQIWGAFMPKQLDNYFKLRLDESSQWEIRQTAIFMRELLGY